MCIMLQECNLRPLHLHFGVKMMQHVVEAALALHHGVNMMQATKKCLTKAHFSACVHASCGLSKQVMASSQQPSSITDDAMDCGKLQERFDTLGVHISCYVCAAILNVFRNPRLSHHGKQIFNLIVGSTGNADKCLNSLLVQMCIEDKDLHQAHILATKLPHLNVLVWNCLIASYAQQEHCSKAFQVFALMQQKGVLPDKVTFVNILAACNSPTHLTRGNCLHHMIICIGCEVDVVLGTALLTMYSKTGSHADMARLFDVMDIGNVVSWTVMIGTYARYQNSPKAFYLHDQMKQEGILPNRVTILNLLEACSCPKWLVNGRWLHSCFVKGLEFDMHMNAALLHMYGKCGTIHNSRALFDLMQERDVVVWNALMAACIRHKRYGEAIQIFYSMLVEGMIPSVVTYVTIVPACVWCTPSTGKSMHAYIVSSGFQDNVVVATALINLYGKLGRLDTAIDLFENLKEQNVVSWNTMIALHAESGDAEGALQFLDIMQFQGMWASNATYVSSLQAYADKEDLPAGKRLHCRIRESSYERDVVVTTALTNMYCRCGTFKDGHKVFKEMPKRNLVSWNTMILACRQHEHGIQGVIFFKQMQWEGAIPDQVTYTNILSICANQLVLLSLGRALHYHIMHSECEPSMVVAASLLDMYGKCGSLEDARRVFDKMSKQSVIVWNVMISNYAQHGYVWEALAVVDVMQQGGVTPNNVTFLALLSAFSHTGMLVEAYHNSISMNFCGVHARAEHCCCLIDLLGRAGQVVEAELAVWKMPLDPSLIGWMTLLDSCRHAFDVKQAGHIVEHILEYDLGIQPQSHC